MSSQAVVKVATWNVNSLRVRLPQLEQWLGANDLDIVALQETKLVDAEFPRAQIEARGYRAAFSGQKTYNGVAHAVARAPIENVVTGLPSFADPQRRVIAASIGGVRVINVYVPNGQTVGSDKFAYKLEWLQGLEKFVAGELHAHERVLLLGDFNVAPEDRDVHDPEIWRGSVLVSADERAAYARLTRLRHGRPVPPFRSAVAILQLVGLHARAPSGAITACESI